jgi:hypothetical protein
MSGSDGDGNWLTCFYITAATLQANLQNEDDVRRSATSMATAAVIFHLFLFHTAQYQGDPM